MNMIYYSTKIHFHSFTQNQDHHLFKFVYHFDENHIHVYILAIDKDNQTNEISQFDETHKVCWAIFISHLYTSINQAL